MLRRAAHAGFTADELAAATFAAATERKRPGPLVHVLFAECTNADAGYDAERLVDAFPGVIEAEGALLDDLPDRLDRFHYDLVATTTFHADEAQALVAGRVPVVAMLVGPGLRGARPRDRRAARAARRVGLVCASDRGADNMRETLALSGTQDVEIVSALIDGGEDLAAGRPDRRPHPPVARGPAPRARPSDSSRPERIRSWTYEFDPSGLELLRRAIDHVAVARHTEAAPARADARLSPATAASAVPCFADARLPCPADGRASATLIGGSAHRHARRPRRRPTSPRSAGSPPG